MRASAAQTESWGQAHFSLASSSAHRAYSRSTACRAFSSSLHRSWSAAGSVARPGPRLLPGPRRDGPRPPGSPPPSLPTPAAPCRRDAWPPWRASARPWRRWPSTAAARATGGRTPIARSRRSTATSPWPSRARISGGDAVEQEAVVGDQHQRARELQQAVLQHLQRRDVEVVGRLVEDQQVGRLQHQPGDAGCAPARRRRAAPTGVSSCSVRKRNRFAQAATWIAPVLVEHRVALRRERPAQGHRRVERLAGSARRARRAGHRPARSSPASGSQLAGEHREQRGLAAAVRPEQAERACPA